MHQSAIILSLLFLLGSLLQVNCGKDQSKRKSIAEATPDENKVVKEHVVEGADLDTKTVAVNFDSTGVESEGNDTSATFTITVSGDKLETDTDLITVPKPRPGMTYLTSLGTLLSEFLTFIGLRSTVERKHRGIDLDAMEINNSVGSYKDGLKTSLGAYLGQRECYQKVTCRAGKYLKTMKVKELVIVVLEKVSPTKWLDTVKMLKQSAIHNDKCEYQCLD